MRERWSLKVVVWECGNESGQIRLWPELLTTSSTRPIIFGPIWVSTKKLRDEVSRSEDGFHCQVDASHGEEVVTYSFLEKRNVAPRLAWPGSKHVGRCVQQRCR